MGTDGIETKIRLRQICAHPRYLWLKQLRPTENVEESFFSLLTLFPPVQTPPTLLWIAATACVTEASSVCQPHTETLMHRFPRHVVQAKKASPEFTIR